MIKRLQAISVESITPAVRRPARVGLLCLLGCLILLSCQTTPKAHSSRTPPTTNHASSANTSSIDLGQIRNEAMALADSYVLATSEATDNLCNATTRPAVRIWAKNREIGTMLAAYSNATGPNNVASLFDMLTLISLQAEETENYWVPNLLHNEGKALLDAQRHAERLAWISASTVMTTDQLDLLHQYIQQWLIDHPNEHYVYWIRFADIPLNSRARGSHETQVPDGLLSLLQINPMAKMGPVTEELEAVRQIGERAMFLTARMPAVMAREMDMRATYAMSSPEVQRLVDNASTLANAYDRLASTAAELPKDISEERRAAIQETAAALTQEREAILQSLDVRQPQLRQMLTDLEKAMDHANLVGASLNEQTRETMQAVLLTENSASRITTQIFVYALILALVILTGVPVAIRLTRRRADTPEEKPRDTLST